jgi:hypothetical protein
VDQLQVGALSASIELFVAGFGFGVVIAPLSSSVLDLTVAGEHGLASSLVVLARTVGMVIGLSALTAFGLARFQAIFDSLRCGAGPPGASLHQRLAALEACSKQALVQEYREIFIAAAIVCTAAAIVCALGLSSPKTRPAAVPA